MDLSPFLPESIVLSMLDHGAGRVARDVADRAFVVAEAPENRARVVLNCEDFVHGRSVEIAVREVRAVFAGAAGGQPVGVVDFQRRVVALIYIIEMIDPARNRAVGVKEP